MQFDYKSFGYTCCCCIAIINLGIVEWFVAFYKSRKEGCEILLYRLEVEGRKEISIAFVFFAYRRSNS